jgi:hypothetical protein
MRISEISSMRKEVEGIKNTLAESEPEREIRNMSDEELHRELARLMYINGSYNGYVFKPVEEYDSMTFTEQSRYIDEVLEVMKPWLEEMETELKNEGVL